MMVVGSTLTDVMAVMPPPTTAEKDTKHTEGESSRPASSSFQTAPRLPIPPRCILLCPCMPGTVDTCVQCIEYGVQITVSEQLQP